MSTILLFARVGIRKGSCTLSPPPHPHPHPQRHTHALDTATCLASEAGQLQIAYTPDIIGLYCIGCTIMTVLQ